MSYLTDQFEEVRTADGNIVRINTSEDKFALLYEPRHDELIDLIEDYERRRIDEYWSYLAEETTLKGTAQPVLKAFKGVDKRAPFYGQAILERVPGLYEPTKGVYGINQYITTLPVTKQREILEAMKPRSYQEAKKIMTVKLMIKVFLIDLKEELQKAGTPKNFIEHTIKEIAVGDRILTTEGLYASHRSRYQAILTLMALKNWLLFPLHFEKMGMVDNEWPRLLETDNYLPSQCHWFKQVYAAFGSARYYARLSRIIFLSSSTRSVSDISAEFLQFWSDYLANHDVLTGHSVGRGRDKVLHAIQHVCETQTGQAIPFERRGPRYKPEKLKRTGAEFGWVAVDYPDKPELVHWAIDLMKPFIKSKGLRVLTGCCLNLSYFLEYLSTCNPIPKDPFEIDRRTHIRDMSGKNKNTYYEHLKQRDISIGAKEDAMRELRQLLDWFKTTYLLENPDPRSFTNPVGYENFGTAITQGQTFRVSLPDFIIDEIKKTITDNDFAFPKSFKNHYVTVTDKLTGVTGPVWYPGVAICLSILLEIPIRVGQARWLDSGLWDEKLLDVGLQENAQTDANGAITGYTTQIAKHTEAEHFQDDLAQKLKEKRKHIAGRKQGFLRQITDIRGVGSFVGLFINTNKTDIYDGSDDNGYEYPWAPPEVVKHVRMMQDWQRRYLPELPELIPYLSGEAGANEEQFQFNPQVHPLFRDPMRGGRLPISKTRLRSFFIKVLKETEERLWREGYNTDNGYDIRLTEWQVNEKTGKRKLAWKYDLHTLRVSGITSMIENGVPIEVVSQFVANHKTLAMTIWYLKHSPGALRDILLAAYKNRNSGEHDEIDDPEIVKNHLQELQNFLLHQSFANGEPGLLPIAMQALQETPSGLWDMMVDGICPAGGRECHKGYEYRPDSGGTVIFGPVPGSPRNCALCRYWVTGPMFLLGQIMKANAVMYAIDGKLREQTSLKDELREHEANRNHSARNATLSRISELDRDLEILVNSWHHRYLYIMASSRMLGDFMEKKRELAIAVGDGKPLPAVPFITNAGDLSGMDAVVAEAHPFILQDFLTQCSELVPGFRASDAIANKHLLLNQALRRNGIEPFLLDLPDDTALEANNIFSSLMLKAATAHGVPIEQLLDGRAAFDSLTVQLGGDVVSLKDAAIKLLDNARAHQVPDANSKVVYLNPIKTEGAANEGK